ncbi:hypothetical protein T492DRAFT_831306 [Pavlovales sp. CCMP2436]|nr:hypothetical protein T492DRAFT_831306 [Pavlovales sp. CCMP2436]
MEKKSKVIEEEATITIGENNTPPAVVNETVTLPSVTPSPTSSSSTAQDVPVKVKRVASEKQRLNIAAANKRRVQILADAKAIRVAAAYEKAREKAALEEYALAIKLSAKYGFTASPSPPVPPSVPPVQQATIFESEGTSIAEPPPFRYFEKPAISIRYTETEDPTQKDNSSDKVIEEINNIKLTIPRFDVDNALGDIPAPLPAQHMFACFLGPPRSDKTSLSTALLTQTAPKVYNGVFDHVWLFVPATSFVSMSDSPFKNHDKVNHELNKGTLDDVIAKLETASKKKQNSLIIIDDFMSSLKENTLRSALEKLISNRRHLRVSVWVISQTFRSIPLTLRKLISALFLFRVSNLRELESIRDELVPRDKMEFQALYNHVFTPGADSHQFMFLDIGSALIYNKFAKITTDKMGAVNNLNRDRLLALTDTDPRHRVTHYLLNGRPYDGAMHPIFSKGKIAPTYMTGPRHHANSEYLVYSTRPILIDTVPQIDLPRLPRDPKTIYNAYQDAGVYDDVLNNVSGQPALNRSIIPARLVPPMLSGRDRPSNSNTTQGFVNPRGAVSGGRGDQVFYSRVPPTVQGPPVIPNSSGVLPPEQRAQPPYGSPVVQGFQVNPAVGVAPLRPPPAPTTTLRPLFGPSQPIDFMRFQQGSSSSQTAQTALPRQSQQPPPLAFIPTTLPMTSAGPKMPSSPSTPPTPPASYETGSSRGSGSRSGSRPAGVN